MSTDDKKKPTAPDGAGDNVNEEIERLRAELYQKDQAIARMKQAFPGGHESWTREERFQDARDTPLWAPDGSVSPVHARPLPPMKFAAVILRSCGTGAILRFALGTKSPEYRCIKDELPESVDATKGPSIRRNPYKVRHVDLETLNGLGVEPQMQMQILAMDLHLYDQERSPFSYEAVANAHKATLGRGRRGDQHRVERLDLPVRRCAGLIESEVRPLASFFEWLDPGATELPAAWLAACQVDDGAAVYEAPFVATKATPFERSQSFAPRMPPAVAPRDTNSGSPPGRY